jgi:hypothetical protein
LPSLISDTTSERAALEVTDAERAVKAVRGVIGKRVTYQQPSRG